MGSSVRKVTGTSIKWSNEVISIRHSLREFLPRIQSLLGRYALQSTWEDLEFGAAYKPEKFMQRQDV
jgi:hypothetical protein